MMSLEKVYKALAAGELSRSEALEAIRSLKLGETSNDVQSVFSTPIWQSVMPSPASGSIAREDKIAIIASEPAQLSWIHSDYRNYVSIPRPSAANWQAITQVLEREAVRQFIWLSPDSCLEEQAAPDIVKSIADTQQDGVFSLFWLVKSLLAAGYEGQQIDVWMITSGALPVTANERVNATHAGVAGFAGALAKEYPQWHLRHIDVPPSAELPSAAQLFGSCPNSSTSIAWREGEWFTQQLAKINQLPESEVVYKQGGIYVVIGGAGGIGELWTRYVVEQHQAQVIWLGRRPLDASIAQKISDIGRCGPAPVYCSVDARDFTALQTCSDDIIKRFGRIDGVVHSAIVLKDKGLRNMTEDEFSECYSTKVSICINLARVFSAVNLDFALFFSSIISYAQTPGQANYSAASVFKDRFARMWQQSVAFPVKVVTWGFWGGVGAVKDPSYHARMREAGIASIESPEALLALKTLLASDIQQLALINVTRRQVLDSLISPVSVDYFAKKDTNERAGVASDFRIEMTSETAELLGGGINHLSVDELAFATLLRTLLDLGLLGSDHPQLKESTLTKNCPPFYQKWLDACVNYLRSTGALSAKNHPVSDVPESISLWREWHERTQGNAKDKTFSAQIDLLRVCLSELSNILTGQKRATDVLFPDSSLHLVERVYKNNPQADYFNDGVAAIVRQLLVQKPGTDLPANVRILEVGAGTGGTTSRVAPVLQPYEKQLAEYCYTDLSQAFLHHAEVQFRPLLPMLKTAIFNASAPVAEQQILPNHYDIVIATNVLHATPNIRETLHNIKAVMKSGGTLILNEINGWSLFSHLTFGLLEGWWLSQDTAVRIPDSAALSSQQWKKVLNETGFHSVLFPADAAHGLGQQLIVSQSNGVVCQKSSLPLNDKHSERQPVAATKNTKALVSAPKTNARSQNVTGLRDLAVDYLRSAVATALKIQPERLQSHTSFKEVGLDSILVVKLTNVLRKDFPEITSTVFFEVENVAGLTDHLLTHYRDNVANIVGLETHASVPARDEHSIGYSSRRMRKPPTNKQPASEGHRPARRSEDRDIAIIGLSGRYPLSNDVNELWANLAAGRNCITEIPAERWSWQKHFDAEKGKPGKSYTKWGGFMSDVDKFDPLFFKISPKEAKKIDPQERLFLQCCYHTIEDAGYTPQNICDTRQVGVFVGVMNSRYPAQPNYFSLANRVSHVFNFQGPSMAVDTACSSSLTAIHLAMESILTGQCDCAIAGGVNVIVDATHYSFLCEMTMLSSGQAVKTFGLGADGFVDAEGVGAVLLKPLRFAERDGDQIYGVIKGSAINAGGRTNGYTVPNPLAQTAVVERALDAAQIRADQISYIEAHGTGTALGDPLEIAGLTKAFQTHDVPVQHCAIGSIKSNVGHCESAAGIAGLTKVLLQMKHKQLVPTLHVESINPEIKFDKSSFFPQTKLQAWQPRSPAQENAEWRRIAGISSFGAGGANAHLIVQDYPVKDRGLCREIDAFVVPLSARTAKQLQQKALALIKFIDDNAALSLSSLAYTAQVGRESFSERVSFVVKTVQELRIKLSKFTTNDFGSEVGFCGSVNAVGATPESGNRGEIGFESDHDVASAWSSGFAVDWMLLWQGELPLRMSLPLYPFAEESYWQPHTDTEERAGLPSVLHPLIHRNMSSLKQQRYESSFTGNESFLSIADGEKRLGWMTLLEMASAALQDANEQNVDDAGVELNDLVFTDKTTLTPAASFGVVLVRGMDSSAQFEVFATSIDSGSTNTIDDAIWCQGAGRVLMNDPAELTINRNNDFIAVRVGSANRNDSTISSSLFSAGSCAIRLEHNGLDSESEEGRLAIQSWIGGFVENVIATAFGYTKSLLPDSVARASLLKKRSVPHFLKLTRHLDNAFSFDLVLYDNTGRATISIEGLDFALEQSKDINGTVELLPIAEPVCAKPKPVVPDNTLFANPLALPVWKAEAKKPNTKAIARTAGPILLRSPDQPIAPTETVNNDFTKISLRNLSDIDNWASDLILARFVQVWNHGAGIYSIDVSRVNSKSGLTDDILTEILSAFDVVKQQSDVRTLVLDGLEPILTVNDAAQINACIRAGLFQRIVAAPFPVILQLQGNVSAFGLMLSTVCDFVFCSENTNMLFSGGDTSAVADGVLWGLFAERFGQTCADQLLLSPTRTRCAALNHLGLSAVIVPRAELEGAAYTLAQELVQKDAKAVALTKNQLNKAVSHRVTVLEELESKQPQSISTELSRVESVCDWVVIEYASDNTVVIKLLATAAAKTLPEICSELQSTLIAISRQCCSVIVISSDCSSLLPAIDGVSPTNEFLQLLDSIQQIPQAVLCVQSSVLNASSWLLGLMSTACIYDQTGYCNSTDAMSNLELLMLLNQALTHRVGRLAARQVLVESHDCATSILLSRWLGSLNSDPLDLASFWSAMPSSNVGSLKAARAVERPLAADYKAEVCSTEKHAELSNLSTPLIGVEDMGSGVVQVQMHDRDNKNLFTKEFCSDLKLVFNKLNGADSVKVIVLTGFDAYFASGGDRQTLLDIQSGKTKFTDNPIFQLPWESALPVVASVQGHAIGGGLTLALFSDIVLLSAESQYNSPYINFGFTPGAGATFILPAGIGGALARESLLSGRATTGKDWEARGVRLSVLARAELSTAANLLATRLASHSRQQLVALKSFWRKQESAALAETYRCELQMHDATFVGNAAVMANIEPQEPLLDLKSHEAPLLETRLHSSSPAITHSASDLLPDLKEMLAAELQLRAADISEYGQFIELGLDSVTGVTLVRKINQRFGTQIDATKIYSHPTLAEFSRFIAEQLPKGESRPATLTSLSVLPAADPVSAQGSMVDIIDTLTTLLARELQMEASNIASEAQFIDLGLDSVTGVTWIRNINRAFSLSLDATLIYSYPTVSKMSAHVQGLLVTQTSSATPKSKAAVPAIDAPLQKSLTQFKSTKRTALTSIRNRNSRDVSTSHSPAQSAGAIAIIGMAGEFAKAVDLEQYWSNIANGVDCITEITDSRWNVSSSYSPEKVVVGKSLSKWMGALENFDKFDPVFFNISPLEAENMDPQQRLFLQTCWHGIEDAGYNPRMLSGTRCGVFVGCTTGDYNQLSSSLRVSAQGFTGGASSILAARISYFLNLHGPCLSIDTACSSSLVAIANACESLNSGMSDMALAGGVCVMATPETHIKTSQAGMQSPSGRCFSFDQRADGIVLGEGVGVVLLKKLSDAIRDGDNIQAVIRGWGINQDGLTNGITAPNPDAQARLQRDVYERFQISPRDIDLIEAHGTGTKLGDPIEIEGLKSSFSFYGVNAKSCAIGSVKSNIGHCAAAAGIAGVIKLALSLQHRQLPPTLHFERLNEHIQLQDSPFFINDSLQEWKQRNGRPRTAAINSFGFSGTNAHIVISEYGSHGNSHRSVSKHQLQYFPFSARDDERLHSLAHRFISYLTRSETVDLSRLAYTLQNGREAMESRLLIMARSRDELLQKLHAFVNNERAEGIYHAQTKAHKEQLSLINQDPELRMMAVNKWLLAEDSHKLAGLWVKGLAMDWSALYSQGKPQKMQIPVYPFAQQRYWCDTSELAPVRNEAVAVTKFVHPLLHKKSADLFEQGYRQPKDGNAKAARALPVAVMPLPTYPFVKQHIWAETGKVVSLAKRDRGVIKNASFIERIIDQVENENLDTDEAVKLLNGLMA